jgi:hypothetical protein
METFLRGFVQRRAKGRCEYCRLHQDDEPYLPFHIEHIIARQHDGSDAVSNRCWSCNHCNLCKGPNLAGIDPQTGKLARLFHPRRRKWSRHFHWDGVYLVGRTAIGRTTIAVLKINHPDRVALRESLVESGAFPPPHS